MLKKTITYVDFNDVERTEDFYFNLSKAELTEMDLSVSGGFTEMINRIVNTQNVPEMVDIFKQLILKSYGVKSDDGRRFIKSKELSDAFEQTDAYSELFMELLSGEEAAAAFINGIIPKSLSDQINKERLKEQIS